MRYRVVLALFGVALLSVAAVAQELAPEPVRRIFAVSALDDDGKPIHGLTAANFHGKYRGQPVKVVSATEDASPRRIAILIDTSASMKENWKAAWAAAEDLVLGFSSDHRVALLTAGEKVQQHAEFTREPEGLHWQLLEAEAESRGGEGPTALFDAIVIANWEFNPPAFADVLYLISDGVDNVSSTSVDRVETALVRSGARLFFLRLQGVDSRRDLRRANRVARQLVEASGGLLLEPRTRKPEKVAAEARLLHEFITYAYRVEVEFPRPIEKRRGWKLQVVGADGKKLKKVNVAYPRLLVPLSEN